MTICCATFVVGHPLMAHERTMKISEKTLRQISADLGLDVPFVKGQSIEIKNCWHFSTDGDSVEAMFYDEDDFRDGMNRVYIVSRKFNVVILAFSLMDTHIHFVLYGSFEDCNRFVHEYARLTSMSISQRHGKKNALAEIKIGHQDVKDDNYLKTVICYDIRNAPVGGLRYNSYDYPWSSGPLYFRTAGTWASPIWTEKGSLTELGEFNKMDRQKLLRSKDEINVYQERVRMIDGIVFPGDYVAYELVEKIFKTHKSFNYFMCKTKESDIDAMGGKISWLSLPLPELRQNRDRLCLEMFGQEKTNKLDTRQRLRLASALKSRYNCSSKQIAKSCGLNYSEVSEML